jgi:hypothetical protein|tara:strand:- start:1132 stop:1896 length:765 start_codon:yes stop_codon:yes gene_type:complete
MNNYFYIGEENSQKKDNENQEIQRNNDKFDKELKKLNDQAFNWTFNDSRRNLGVGIYGNLVGDNLNQSSRYPTEQNQSLQLTSNDRINDHIFNNHQNQTTNEIFEVDSHLRNMKFNNYNEMKQNISRVPKSKKKIKKKKNYNSQNPFQIFEKKNEDEDKNISLNPRQNKFQHYPNPNISFNSTINAENDMRYNKIKKKTENTSNPLHIHSKRKNLLRPRPNITRHSEHPILPTNDNNYIDRFIPINSKNPNNRI